MKGPGRGILVLALSTVVVAALAGSAFGQTEEDEPLTYHVGTTSDMVSANPFKACCTSEYEMLLLNYNMLYGFSAEDLSPVPELTTGCEPSSDYMEWTCPIRDDAVWHDGEPLTAEDIAFTYRFILDNNIDTFADYLPFEPTFETPDPTHPDLEVHRADPGTDRAPLHPDPPRARLGGARRQAAEGDPGLRGHPLGRLRAVPADRVGGGAVLAHGGGRGTLLRRRQRSTRSSSTSTATTRRWSRR